MFGKYWKSEGVRQEVISAQNVEKVKERSKLEHQALGSMGKDSTKEITKTQESLINDAFSVAYAAAPLDAWVEAEQSVTIRKEGDMWSVWCGKEQTTHSTYIDAMLYMAGILEPKMLDEMMRGNKDE